MSTAYLSNASGKPVYTFNNADVESIDSTANANENANKDGFKITWTSNEVCTDDATR
jgi:hypothetical protein